MLSRIEFYNCPDGSVAVKPDGEAMFIYEQENVSVTEDMIVLIKDLYPEAFQILSELYSKSSRNKDYFQYRIVHRFLRCNFGGYDALRFDIDGNGRFNFEDVKCPLRGECIYEGKICKPTLKTALSEREREVAKLVASGMNRQEIAEELGISLYTVIRHIANIKFRLKLKNTNQIMAYFSE